MKSNYILVIICIVALIFSADCFSQNNQITLTAVGDILLARLPGKHLLASSDPSFPFSQIRKYFLISDIAFANLECPISERGTPYPGKPENITFRAPLKALTALGNSGLTILSLANNHANDFGPIALHDTIHYLNQKGIKVCGAGRYSEEASKPVFITAKGIQFAFLGFAEPVWSTRQALPWKNYRKVTLKENRMQPDAKLSLLPEDFAGITYLAAALKSIQQIKQENPDRIIVVSIHWGIEHAHYPEQYQITLAHSIIDAGATIILGHHPHVLQSIELYNKGIILYSMGNFVFDMASDATYESALFQFTFTGNTLASLSILPVVISRKNFAPALADTATGANILKNIQTYSQKLNTTITISNGTGMLAIPTK
ncbi:MAG TPA: CapA family protein [Spirochaetia bacterium]|nr:CapA family protein [Spirochaetales bacterium]HRS65595.1 CapA family protein [Spirochaetia bacterium]HOT58853.1 CapA family protein [Spirochaetales bacterium]HPD80592.1 CapA family protein [Spirochaetales bacterium]HQK33291.1 CapA family protein [Spirochaetales bacterium]